jgi:hypothetical protein
MELEIDMKGKNLGSSKAYLVSKSLLPLTAMASLDSASLVNEKAHRGVAGFYSSKTMAHIGSFTLP